jgi:hypothetical protein
MSREHLIELRPDGTVHFIYDDALAGLLGEGSSQVARASHVEPTAEHDENGRPTGNTVWYADMAPVGGPMLGPFKLRETALAEEVAWLEKTRFGDHQPVEDT